MSGGTVSDMDPCIYQLCKQIRTTRISHIRGLWDKKVSGWVGRWGRSVMVGSVKKQYESNEEQSGISCFTSFGSKSDGD